MGSQPPSGTHLLRSGVFHRLQVDISTVDLHGLQGTACLTVVFTMGCRGTSTPVPGALPSPPSALTVGSAKVFLSGLLSLLLFSLAQGFFFFYLS